MGLPHLVLAVALLFLPSPASAQARRGEHWIGTWATAAVARPQTLPVNGGGPAPAPLLNFHNQTIRQIVHASIGGEKVRIVFSNAFGTEPLALGDAHVALRRSGPAVVPGSDRALTFAGRAAAIIPAGAVIVSDSVTLHVPPLSDLAITIFLPGDTAATTSPLTMHGEADVTNYVSAAGDYASASDLPGATPLTSWFFLARVEVTAPERAAAIVALGDSITDGNRSTPNANRRWTDQLSRRLMAHADTSAGVLNAGINGNRILQDAYGASASARFDRDVAAQTGATFVILFEGINDIRNNSALAADDVIAGLRQIIERAHARELRIIGATVTPWEGSGATWTPQAEEVRAAVNAWIRTGGAYDGVIDFDAVLRDPEHPSRLLEQYQAGDRLHPNDAGYRRMGNAIDLELFAPSQHSRSR